MNIIIVLTSFPEMEGIYATLGFLRKPKSAPRDRIESFHTKLKLLTWRKKDLSQLKADLIFQ